MRTTSSLTPGTGRARLASRVGRVRGLPGPLRVVRARRRAAGVGGPARLGRASDRAWAGDAVRVVRRRPRRSRAAPRHIWPTLGANVLYLTPVFPAGSTHRYDARTFDAVDPLLGGDEALASLVRAAHDRGHPRPRRPHDEPRRARSTSGSSQRSSGTSRSAGSSSSTTSSSTATSAGTACRPCRS